MGCWFSGLRKRRRDGSKTPTSRAEGAREMGDTGSSSIRRVRTVMPSRRARASLISNRLTNPRSLVSFESRAQILSRNALAPVELGKAALDFGVDGFFVFL